MAALQQIQIQLRHSQMILTSQHVKKLLQCLGRISLDTVSKGFKVSMHIKLDVKMSLVLHTRPSFQPCRFFVVVVLPVHCRRIRATVC